MKARRSLILALVASMLATFLPLSAGTAAADASIFTDYVPTITEVIDADSGFKHPGVGLTKDILENLQTQVRAQQEPWNTYFEQMLLSPTADRNVTSSNQSGSDPTQPDSKEFNSQSFNSRFIADGLKAYTQAILYVITGDEAYRANAMRIIRIWSRMDPAKYAYFTDAHIHTGIPLNRIVTAAEILRYTSTENPDLAWTEQDTADFTNNLITPTIETFNHFNDRFMNQHLYPLLGAMSGYIFTNNLDRYKEGVEWFTVNKTAVDQGQNGAIKALFRLVDTNAMTGEPVDPPVVQHVEMGRDQAHGAGDITNVEIIARLLLAQGTKVDPVDGTFSTAPDAVGPYEFLDNRILHAAEFFARFMLGYDTPWVPTAAHTDADGNPTIIYRALAEGYRGRIGGNVYDLYYYYKYEAGVDMTEAAPYFHEMFAKRHTFYWESPDGGADYWLYIPAEAEAEGGQYLPRPVADQGLREIEDRYTAFDANSVAMQEGSASFVRITATEAGSRIALIASSAGDKTIGFRVRTNGTAKLELIRGINDTITLPDTKGQWRYVTYAMNNFQGLGDLLYLTAKGSGTVVDIDHINLQAGAQLTPPAFRQGSAPLKLFAYAGSDAAVQFDFSATDAGAGDVVSYQMDHLPAGAAFSGTTGAFSWTPSVEGTYRMVVGASDGTTVSTRDVEIVVAHDRASAVAAATAPYDAGTIYEQSTLEAYLQSYNGVTGLIATASDTVFYQKLAELSLAVDGLREVTPHMPDGSMDYRDMFVTSTMGNELPNALDGAADSFVGYYLAQDRAHIMDFGPGFRVSADAFELQVRASFPERIGGVTMFGSNDKENWTRLTPGLTEVSEDMQRLEVADELKDTRFRFLKMQMIDPPPVTVGLEISEFRIYGLRHEVINKLAAVSIGSDQALAGRIVQGDTIKLSFTTTEPIREVRVRIEGQAVTAHSDDASHWSAQLVAGEEAAPGRVNFSINYKTADGADGAETIFTTDNSMLYLADESDLIEDLLEITDLSDSSGRNKADLLATAAVLFDGNPGTITDFRVNGSGNGGYIVFDFRAGRQVRLTSVELLARQDNYASRLDGTVVQGSSDNTTWTTLTPAASGSPDWQLLPVNSDAPYRYIRVINGNNWYGNMSELRLHGTVTVSMEDVLADAQSAPAADYTKGSYYSYRQELERIRAELAAPGYVEAQMLNEIARAKQLLVPVESLGGAVDKTLLSLLLADAEDAIATGIYSEASVQTLQQAIDDAAAVSERADASQAEADAACDSLHAAVEALQYAAGMPVLEGLHDVTVQAEQTLVITAEAVNAAADAYGIGGPLPTGASFDAAAHTLQWTPTRGQGGTYEITFTVSAGGLSSARTIVITVIGEPVFEPAEIVPVTAGQRFSYRVEAVEPTGRWLTYSASGLPAGAKFDAKTGLFAWTAAQTDYGSHAVTFTVSNGTFAVSRTVAFQVGLHILPAEDYTKASYARYYEEAQRIATELGKPEADLAQLLSELQAAEATLVPVPLSLYSFEGNADNAFGSTHGTVEGTQAYAAGKFGQAIDLNGADSYVQLPADYPLTGGDEITVSAWIYWRGGNQWQRIFDFGNDTSHYLFLSPRSGNNTLRFAIINGGSEQYVEAAQLAANQWVHVAVTLGGGAAKLYVNGELKTTGNISIKPSDFHPSVNYIGRSMWPDPLFNGLVDEFHIYDRALDAAQIQSLMSASAEWVDKSLLLELLEAAADVNPTIYTPETVDAFRTAFANAQSADGNPDAIQADIDAAADVLQQALDQLAVMEGVPVLELADRAVAAGQTLSFAVKAVNADEIEGEIVYGASELPQGASFDAQTQTFQWTPAMEQGGVYAVTFSAAVGELRSSRKIRITVFGQPTITSEAAVELTAKEAFAYRVIAQDPAGQPLQYRVTGLPQGAAFDAAEGMFTWTPSQADYGRYPVKFIVDNGYFEASLTVDMDVKLNIVPPQAYTKLSYYLYMQELARIEAGMNLPGADKPELAAQLAAAEQALVPASTLPAEKIAVDVSMVAASHESWDKTFNPAQNGWQAMDGSTATFTDAAANPAWILVDLGAGNEKAIGSVRFYPRSTHVSRVNGAIIQGSNDGTEWTDLYTISGISTAAWYTGAISSDQAFRYLRYYSASSNANVAEVEYYTAAVDKTLLAYLIAQADGVEAAHYTPESVAALRTVAAAVQAVAGDNQAAQTQVDDASRQLQAAIEGLAMQGVRIEGPLTVDAGQLLSVTIGIVNVTQSVYGISMELQYDPADFVYMGAESLVEGYTVTGSVYGDRAIQLTLTAGGTPPSGPLGGTMAMLGLQFRALMSGGVPASVMQLANVKAMDETGQETELFGGPVYRVGIADIAMTDKSGLLARIAEAQAAAANAVVSDHLWGHYAATVVDALNAGIRDAQAAAANDATQAQIDEALGELDAALELFLNSVNTNVGIADLEVIAAHYGMASGSSDWAQVKMYDANDDGKLDVVDLAAAAKRILGSVSNI